MSTGESLKLGLELNLRRGDFQLHAKDIGPNCNPSAHASQSNSDTYTFKFGICHLKFTLSHKSLPVRVKLLLPHDIELPFHHGRLRKQVLVLSPAGYSICSPPRSNTTRLLVVDHYQPTQSMSGTTTPGLLLNYEYSYIIYYFPTDSISLSQFFDALTWLSRCSKSGKR